MKNLIFILAIGTLFITSCAGGVNANGTRNCGANDQYGKWHTDSDCNGVTDDGYPYGTGTNGGGTTTNAIEQTGDAYISQADAMAAYTSYIDEKLMFEQVGTGIKLTVDFYPVYFKSGGRSVLVAVSVSQLKNLAAKTVWPVQIATSKVFWTHDGAQSTQYYMQ